MKIFVEGLDGSQLSLTFYSWSTVKELKDKLRERFNVRGNKYHIMFRNEELRKNNRLLSDYNITDGCSLSVVTSECSDPIRFFNFNINSGTHNVVFDTLVDQARQGIRIGLKGKLSDEGTGGTYFLRNARKQKVLVFKPADEEAFAPNNPRGYTGRLGSQGFRPGIHSGEGHLREVAAYILDHENFHGVPRTARMEIECSVLGGTSSKGIAKVGTKVGSMQEYVPCSDVTGNISPTLFSVDEVHKIGLLDIRLVNTDRNEANILVCLQEGEQEHLSRRNWSGNGSLIGAPLSLVPIDHANCLPSVLEIAWTDWSWLEWPQAKVSLPPKTKDYIMRLDVAKDAQLLRSCLSIREPCLQLMMVTNMLLQKGIGGGLTLYDIGTIIVRKDIDEPSNLEIMCSQAAALAFTMSRCSLRTRIPSMISDCSHSSSLHPPSSPPALLLESLCQGNLDSKASSKRDMVILPLCRSMSCEVLPVHVPPAGFTGMLLKGSANRREGSKPQHSPGNGFDIYSQSLFLACLSKLMDSQLEYLKL